MSTIKLTDVALCAMIINLVMSKHYELEGIKDQKTIPAAAIKTLFSAIL